MAHVYTIRQSWRRSRQLMEANGDINNGKRRVNRREQWLWRENRLALLDPITFGCKALFIALGTHAWDEILLTRGRAQKFNHPVSPREEFKYPLTSQIERIFAWNLISTKLPDGPWRYRGNYLSIILVKLFLFNNENSNFV